MFKIIAVYVYTCDTIRLYAVYMNMHGNLQEVVHYIAMHIDMHGNITAHAYGIISSFTYK